MSKKIKNNKDINIEDAFNQLSQIVSEIEKDNISLENALKLFEDGMALTKICKNKLKNAEEKVNSLIDKNKIK
tara:strand:+ start:90 stop:308 length:219 start_codon:yes stop_codon:yes gene_type:complete